MKICVYGLWHLGCVTATCLAEAGFSVIALEDDDDAAERLANGHAPLFEPGLDDLVQAGLAKKTLSVTTDKRAVGDTELIWITYDTPVDEDDHADVDLVVEHISGLFPYLRDGAVVLVSSQLPVGTMAEIERRFAEVAGARRGAFACSAEPLRLGGALALLPHPERVISRVAPTTPRRRRSPRCLPVLGQHYSVTPSWRRKHAINAFAASVTPCNEIAVICEQVGADAREVERGLRSERRIGEQAYIRPGAAFAGGTLARDVMFLCEIARRNGLPSGLLGSIVDSNRAHARWPWRKLTETFGKLRGLRVALLGLSYKPGTDTLRRSVAVELARDLAAGGAKINAFDPAVRGVPRSSGGWRFGSAASLAGTVAVV
jgi:UDPglucose 6-dehydrogenase